MKSTTWIKNTQSKSQAYTYEQITGKKNKTKYQNRSYILGHFEVRKEELINLASNPSLSIDAFKHVDIQFMKGVSEHSGQWKIGFEPDKNCFIFPFIENQVTVNHAYVLTVKDFYVMSRGSIPGVRRYEQLGCSVKINLPKNIYALFTQEDALGGYIQFKFNDQRIIRAQPEGNIPIFHFIYEHYGDTISKLDPDTVVGYLRFFEIDSK